MDVRSEGHEAANLVRELTAAARTAAEAGDDLSGYFPPALGTPVNLGDAGQASYLNDRLNALNNHTMTSVIDRMEERKTEDQATLSAR